MNLSQYLQSIGRVTGPRDTHTSYSGLEVIRKYLLDEPQFQGSEDFLWIGIALHELVLENKKGDAWKKLTVVQKKIVKGMADSLLRHPVFQQLTRDAVKEKKENGEIDGVPVVFILDAKQLKLKRGADVKTTVCTSYRDCVEKAVLYYPRQRFIYKTVSGLREFYFIFISKVWPHPVFIIGDAEFKDHEKYVAQEMKFLLYFYKHYGKFINPNEVQRQVTDGKNTPGVRPVKSVSKLGAKRQTKRTNKISSSKVSVRR